ncbi:MAG: hypothetical protein KDJ35_09350 [Alphaproteobacteria bacterium]|nr:hypothetical protein [Alphaproteobacteria bacterium]
MTIQSIYSTSLNLFRKEVFNAVVGNSQNYAVVDGRITTGLERSMKLMQVSNSSYGVVGVFRRAHQSDVVSGYYTFEDVNSAKKISTVLKSIGAYEDPSKVIAINTDQIGGQNLGVRLALNVPGNEIRFIKTHLDEDMELKQVNPILIPKGNE